MLGAERERYLVYVNGEQQTTEPVVRGAALSLVCVSLDGGDAAEVVVADARTLEVRALWRRSRGCWSVRAPGAWLQ